MKIDSSAVTLSAYSSQTSVLEASEQVEVQENLPDQDGMQQLAFRFDDLQGIKVREANTFEISDKDAMEIEMLRKMIEALTGRKMRFFIPEKRLQAGSESGGGFYTALSVSAGPSASLSRSVTIRRQEVYAESAQMHFGAAGTVNTADGKKIRFSLDLSVSRSFLSASSETMTTGAAADPLVVNYNGASAQLTANKFSFDIDNDGMMDNISFASHGSGFLVFDRNMDGVINDGSEMFGPSTGNGFIELKAFDADANGWIDENDPIYDRLQIWAKDEAGSDRLFAIGQAGIGAIYLGGISSFYELKDSANALHGTIRETSIFLRENGTAGTIQHVDLSI